MKQFRGQIVITSWKVDKIAFYMYLFIFILDPNINAHFNSVPTDIYEEP